MNRFLFWLPAAAAGCAGQVSLGVNFGARTTTGVSGDGTSESKRYVAGPSLSVALGRGFSVETGFLYQRFGYRTGTGSVFGSYSAATRANVWEMPLLVERRFTKGEAGRPFVLAGYAPRWIRGREHGEGINVNPSTGERNSYAFDTKWNPAASHGLVAGGGLEFARGRIRIRPEVRYVRWNRDVINLQGSQGYHVNAARNEVRAMVGIRFP